MTPRAALQTIANNAGRIVEGRVWDAAIVAGFARRALGVRRLRRFVRLPDLDGRRRRP